jgi:hypothetical protein
LRAALPEEKTLLQQGRLLLQPGSAPELDSQGLAESLERLTTLMETSNEPILDLALLTWEAGLWPQVSATEEARQVLAQGWSRYAVWLCAVGRSVEAADYAGRALSLACSDVGRPATVECCLAVIVSVTRAATHRDAPLRALAWLRKWLPPLQDPELEDGLFRKLADEVGLRPPAGS